MSTQTIHTKTEKRLVPLLRFKEFAGKYIEYRLSDLMIRYSENNKDEEFSIDDILSLSVQHGIVDRKELLDDTYSRVNHKNYIKTRLNDFVYGKSISANYPFGVFKANNFKDGLLSTLYFTFRVFENTDPIYLESYFSHQNRANNFLRKYVLVGDRYITADPSYILSGKIFIPSYKEQRKIASFLTSVNAKLQQLTQKKELLQQYKKGAMQQLFSQQLRFKQKNGNDYPDWEYPHANELFKSISDKDHNGDLPILAISQEFGAIPRELINYKISVEQTSVDGYKVVQKGDFIISLRSFQGGIEYSNYHGICSPAYNILRPASENVVHGFYRRYLKTEFYIKQLQSKLEGIRDGKMISYKYFSEIKLPFPSKEEQKQITSYLSALDTKIETVTQQIEKTQEFKKGLLQQLFV